MVNEWKDWLQKNPELQLKEIYIPEPTIQQGIGGLAPVGGCISDLQIYL